MPVRAECRFIFTSACACPRAGRRRLELELGAAHHTRAPDFDAAAPGPGPAPAVPASGPYVPAQSRRLPLGFPGRVSVPPAEPCGRAAHRHSLRPYCIGRGDRGARARGRGALVFNLDCADLQLAEKEVQGLFKAAIKKISTQ